MRLKGNSISQIFGAMGLAVAAMGAEAGDADGDGRISLADALLVRDRLRVAPGSLAAFEGQPCHATAINTQVAAGAIYLESLRRSVTGSLAHWVGVWQTPMEQSPLVPDGRALLLFEPMEAPGGADDRLRVAFTLVFFETTRAFSLILEAPDGILRAGFHRLLKGNERSWDEGVWRNITDDVAGEFASIHNSGSIAVGVGAPASLVTGGRYVIAYGVGWPKEVLVPGEYLVVAEARLPKGTPRGFHTLNLLPGSEVILEDGTLIAPELVRAGEVHVAESVTVGLDEQAPPLRFDAPSRRVLGQVEFRVANSAGHAPGEDEPVAEGFPGEEVSFRVQMRTEVPLNDISFQIAWPYNTLLCAQPQLSLFTHPDEGIPYVPRRYAGGGSYPVCGADAWSGGHSASFQLGGVRLPGREDDFTYMDRPLEYFRPLGEWVDLTEVRARIPPGAGGGSQVSLAFQPHDSDLWDSWPNAQFLPYATDPPCSYGSRAGESYWSYDVQYQAGFVRVLGNQEPEPPDLGVRIAVGDASGAPGEILEVPVLAATQEKLFRLRIALEIDPQALEIQEVTFRTEGRLTGEVSEHVVPRGSYLYPQECADMDGDGQEECFSGIPSGLHFHDTDAPFVLADITMDGDEYPGDSLVEVLRLRARIRDDFGGSETSILSGKIKVRERIFELEAVSGGQPFPYNPKIYFAPAREVRSGNISIAATTFVRGDSNSDGRVDVSDAVTTLSFLFAGGDQPVCLDGSDADDSGRTEITDAIFLMGALFLGQGAVPEPYPLCGLDPTADGMSCQAGCEGRRK